MFKAHETILTCNNDKCGSHRQYFSQKLLELIPYRCKFGYDVLVFVGKKLFLQCRNIKEIKLPSEKAKEIIPLLKHIKKIYGVPLALVHDMGKGILAAVKEVFPGVADYICHFHFLRDIGKDLFGKENHVIRNRLKKYGTLALLRKIARRLKEDINKEPKLIESFIGNWRESRGSRSLNNQEMSKPIGEPTPKTFCRPYRNRYPKWKIIHSTSKDKQHT